MNSPKRALKSGLHYLSVTALSLRRVEVVPRGWLPWVWTEFTCRVTAVGRRQGGVRRVSDADWFALADLDDLDIHPSVRLRIDHALHHPDTVDIS